MAKVNGREDALLNAYLNRYQTAQASNVSTGRSTTRKAQQQGSAVMNATDKTLPVLHNSYTETLNNIVQGANLENSLNNDILNRQMKLAQAKFDAANDLYQQQQKAQQYAAKKAAKAAKSSRKSSGKGGSTTGTGSDTESAASLDSLFGDTASTGGNAAGSADTARNKGGNYDPKRTNEERNASARARYDDSKQEKSDIKYRAKQKAERTAQLLKDKQAAANAGANKGKPSGNSYAERQSAAQPTQSRAVTRGGKVIGSSYAAAGSAPSASERTSAKQRQERVADILQKLQSDAGYRAELAAPGRKLDSAEVEAVNQYEKSTKNTGFSGLKRVFETAANKEGLSQEDYAKKTAAMNAELNQNSALRGKAQMNGAGQTAQAFTAGLYDSVPFLRKSVDKLTDIANKTGAELPQLSNAIEGAKSYDPLAAAAGTLVGKGMQYDLFNTAMAGTPLAQRMGKAGNAVVGQAQKIPVLGDVLGAGSGDALGRIFTDTTADLALDTLPSLVNDVSEGKSAGEIAGNTAKNIAGNVAMNALPEIGGALFNRLKGTAGDATQDALKQADKAVQDAQSAVPARNIVQPEANGTTGLAAQIQQMNTPDAANRSALNTLDELRGQVNLNGAQEKEAEQLRRAVLQRQQEIGDEAKLALQNTDSLPIDAQRAAGYNEVNGGVQNDNLGAGVRADISLNADAGAGYEPQPGGGRSGLAGQTGAAGPGSTASGNGAGVQGTASENAQTVAEWAKSITGKGRQSVYTRRIENLHNAMQNGASRESLSEEAAKIAAGLVKESNFAEPLDEATSALREYMKSTPIRLDEKAAGDILYTSGLKNIQQYNIQNGTKFSLTDGIPYDTAMQELGEMSVGVNGSSIDDLLRAVDASNAKPIVDSDRAAAVADYYRDFILDGPSDRQLGADDFADWLDVQSFDRDAPDYVQRLLERDNLTAIDAATDTGYNDINNIGGVTNEAVQGRNQYDGTRSEGILRGSSDGTPQSGQRLAVGAESGEYLPANRVLVAEHLNQRPSVYNDSTRAIAEQAGAGAFDFRNSDDAPETFAQALATAKANNVNGAAVDGHTAEEIANIVNNGGKTFLTPDGTAGGAVEANGNLTCVFKDAANNSTPGAGSSIALAAVNDGATKGDCYGRALVNMYSKAGLEPVARIPYAYGYNDAMDAQVRKQIADGIISKEPDVYALKLRDGYDFEKAAAEFNTAHRYTQAELDALPVYDDYDEMLAYRDSLLKSPSADAGSAAFLQPTAASSEPVPGLNIAENAQSVAKLNGSESVPENAVGATNARYSTDKIVENKDYANQAATRAVLDDAHREGLTYSKHQVWTDTEAQHQALDDINTYIQEAGGDVDKGLENAMNSLRKDTQWDKGESVTANNIRDRLRTEYMNTEPGTPEFYRQKARYDDWQSEISKQRSKVAQTMQSFTGDASARMHEVSNPIREKWETQHSVEAARIKQLSDELDKLKTAVAQRNLDDMNSQDFTKGVVSGADRFPVQDNVKFPQSIREGIQKAGDMDAEFGQMLKDNGIPTHEERVASFSDADKEKYKTATEEAYNSILARVKKLCEKNKVNIDDDGVKTIAGKIMNGDNAESYYNSLIMQAAGISDLSIDEMEMVDDLYSTAAKLPDGKEKYQMEAQAVGIMAKHLPAKSWFERFDNIRYLAMLGNPTTHGKNIIGNILMKGLSDTKDEVAAAMQLVTTKKADRTKALYVPQDMKKAASKWIDENHYAEVIKDGGKYNLDSGLDRARSTYGQNLVGRALQKASDFNSNLLDKEDEIFVKMGATHSLANILTARGYDASIFTKTDEASQRVLLDALETAKRDAKDVTFHTETALTRGMEKLSKWGDKKGDLGEKIKYCIGQGLLPFAKTPSNILKTAAEYNPVGATFEAGYRAYHHEGSAAVTDALAKGVVGSGIMAVGYWLAHEGFLTGMLDEDTKDYDKMLGKQEYSVNIPGVGSYTLDWAAPAIVPLMIGANLEQGGYNLDTLMQDPGNLDKLFGEVIDVFMNALDPIQNMTMMQGINNTLDNIRYSDENAAGSVVSLASNLGTGYLQQFVPTALSKAAKTLDDTRRSTYGGGSSASERNKNYLLRSTMNKIPGLSKESEPYIDQWGREEASLDGTGDDAEGMFLRGLYNFSPLSPGYYSAENVTPVDEYLQGLYGSTNDKHDLPEKAKNYLSVDNENYYMTPEEKTEYAKTSGQTAYDLVDELRQNSMFLRLPEDQQSALVQDAYKVAKTAGGVAAVGDGVSGVDTKEYEAYRDGGAEGFSQYVLMKNATDLVRDEKRETSGNDDAKLNAVETWNTLYSQFGDDAVSNFVNSTDKGSTVRNISNLAGDKAVAAYMQAYSAVAKTLDDDQTPDKFTVGYGMQKYGLSGDDFARAYLAAYYKKDKNGKYPEKGGSYADKAGAEIYQSYGADALRDWVNYRATIPDTNGNGKADKDEAVARLKEMDLTNEMRRAYLAKTNKQWGKKNPF